MGTRATLRTLMRALVGDSFQAMPLEGYTKMFSNILDHSGITVELGVSFEEVRKRRGFTDIVYTGQFRVGGSQWFDIPGQVDLQSTPVTLTVREAKARLYTP